MAKISKTVPQKEDASSSRLVGEKPVVEPRLEELILERCVIDSNLKDEKTSSVAGRCLGKDAVMRPLSGDKEFLPPISKSEKVIKRKRASDSEGQKPKKRAARKPKASVLHHEREGEVKGLRAKLEASRKEQAELAEKVKRIFEFNDIGSGVTANSSVPQVEKKFDVIRKLRVEVHAMRVEAEEWKKNIDRLASEKEAARAQLASVEAPLPSIKEKALVQAKKIEEFQSWLSSANSDRERLVTELAATKSEAQKTMANADALVAVYRSDTEAAQVRAKEVAEAAQARANLVAEHPK
ncbi:uncharacterized protein [Nicotiana tomentosiformis]|uniref:uncharacterized protein n=1 Tax=Nicotiana tomentosiformis TaxID=4098 RepID=UPI00388C959F